MVVKFANGDSCTATHSVTVHPTPVAAFSVSGASSYCLNNNKVCITDNSAAGPTGNPIAKRVFLWDDGAGDNTTRPDTQKTLCHTYGQTGNYTLVIETTDDKGCIAKTTRAINIFPDYNASYQTQLNINPTTCKFEMCFENDTKPMDTLNLAGFEWDFGDGKKDTLNLNLVCHDYDVSGVYHPRLIMKHKSGCSDTFSTVININKPTINFNLLFKRSVCAGDTVDFFNNALNPGAKYNWYVKDSSSGKEYPLGPHTNPVKYLADRPGKTYLKLNIQMDSCQKTIVDTLEVKCPVASFTARNDKLCTEGDTTYFCDETCYYQSFNHTRLWDFGHGAQCTTDTKKGINVTQNCRYSVDENPKHVFYFTDSAKKTSCFQPKLYVKDTVNGCESDVSTIVLLGRPSLDNLVIRDTGREYCTDIGDNSGRVIQFEIKGLSCKQAWPMFMNFDSAGNPFKFEAITPDPWPGKKYTSTGDPSGDITIGFVTGNGSPDFYSSCNTVAGPGTTCYDTIWYHHKFNIAPVPNPYVPFVSEKACAPYNFTVTLDDTVQYGVKRVIWDWGDSTADSLDIQPGDSTIPTMFHTYWKNGIYTPQITMINTRGCKETQFLTLGLGYFNAVVFDTVVCAGDSTELKEILFYYDNVTQFWIDSARIAQGREKLWWDFDDGKGFVKKKPGQKVVFAQEGTYHVRMASEDSTGCVDTFSFDIKAVKADAYIRAMPDTFYCNDNILRFYDSSFGSPQIPGDVVTGWQWEFGDGKTPSYLKDPFHYYSSFGEKRISLVVKSAAGCRDTAFKDIVMIGPVPKFEIITDSVGCDPVKVTFKNTSKDVRTWIWYMGDPAGTTINTDKDTSITFTYTPPGEYFIKLYGADSIYNPSTKNTYFCASFYPDTPMVKKVVVLPYFKANFEVDDTVCQNIPATFVSTSHPRYDIFRWWFGNGDSLDTIAGTIQYTYSTPGNYRVDFRPSYTPTAWERLCILDTFKNITVISIEADFDISPASEEPVFFFTNKSTNADRYEWDFGHPASGKNNTSALKDPSHNYKLDRGTFLVCLRAYNKEGCYDSVCKPVSNNYEPRLFIPNVFTPDKNDTLNKLFDIDIYKDLYYHIAIYNRWGEKVFEGFNDGKGNTDDNNWNGRHHNTGDLCPPGVYYVVFEYEILGYDERKTYNGTLTLFRED